MAKSRPSPTAPTVVAGEAIADAVPSIPTIDLRVAQSKAEAALFGASEAVRIGRYRIIERVGAGGMGIVWSAWDPELGRAVALKLASSGDAEARALARDEARALARLSHPNVVPIYDVLDHDDRVLLVMELIKGESLRAASKTRSPAQIVRDYRQAGEGLAAAHAAGLIHRDFKPDNALLGADGRVRVLDFGLAHDAGGGEGFVAGTPGYMAPEQERGEKLTAAVDQFALCVALREALTARGGVPRWLQPILARGTSAKATDRFPSMVELVGALARDPASRWRRRAIVGGGVAALIGTAGAFLLGRAQQAPSSEEPCSGGPAHLADAWGAERRAAVQRNLQALPGNYATDATPRFIATVDRYAQDWVALHRESCRAHSRHELSDELYDRRVACLNRPRAAIRAISDLASGATAHELAGLVAAATKLPAIAACADDASLIATVAPPSPELAAEVAAIDSELARVGVERDAGQVEHAARHAEPLVTRAEASQYAPVLARALLARGRVALTGQRADYGAGDFARAVRTGLSVGDDILAVEAWARRAWAVAMVTESGIGSARDGLELILGLDERNQERGRFARALLHNNLGGVALAEGDRAVARTEFELAYGIGKSIVGPDALEASSTIENLLLIGEDPVETQALGRALVEQRTALLGPTHPSTLEAEIMAASAAADLRACHDAFVRPLLDLATYHPDLGSLIGHFAQEALMVAAAVGEPASVARIAAAVIAAADHGADPDDVELARGYAALADAGHAIDVLAPLVQRYRSTVATPWWKRKRAADIGVALAVAYITANRRAAALALLDELEGVYQDIATSMSTATIAHRRQAIAQLRAMATRLR